MSRSNALGENHDKKRRTTSLLAAAIIEYLSSDLADEQAKLNSTLNGLIARVDSKARTVVACTGVEVSETRQNWYGRCEHLKKYLIDLYISEATVNLTRPYNKA